MVSRRDIDLLFNHYDQDKSGVLEYKEFSAIICSGSEKPEPMEKKAQAYGAGFGAKPVGQGDLSTSNINNMLGKVRQKLAGRGARGIIGLGRSFRIMDDNNSRSLDIQEFTKAMKECMLGLGEQEIQTLFATFDRNRDQSIDYDEFIRTIRGPMNNFRKRLVGSAFRKIDRDGNGYLDINDIKGVYNASRHPDVIQGKKTEDEVMMDFLETFEAHHNIVESNAPDHIVTVEEFEEYYNNISSSIDNDQYFELMMNNTWKLNEAAQKVHNKGWSSKERSSPQKAYQQRSPAKPM